MENPRPDQTKFELFNLENDPEEKNNIVEENKEIRDKLFSKYYNIINRQPHFEAVSEVFGKLNQEQKNNLYLHGYF